MEQMKLCTNAKLIIKSEREDSEDFTTDQDIEKIRREQDKDETKGNELWMHKIEEKIDKYQDEMNKQADQNDSCNSDNVLEALSLTSSPQEERNAEDQTDGLVSRVSTEVSTSAESTVDADFDKKLTNEEEKELSSRKRKYTESTADEDDVSDGNEVEFCWDDYLDVSSSIATPPTSFLHVENSLVNILKVGMKLEIPNSTPRDTYWLASVVMTCGPLLSLRYIGFGDDRSKDFWYDVQANEVHLSGWCTKNNKELFPPSCVLEKCPNSKEIVDLEMKQIQYVPDNLLELLRHGATPVEQIKQGMKVEVQEELNPVHVWISTIVENVGGRLLLRYDGITSHDFWVFYLSHRIHAVGWGNDNGCHYNPPKDFKNAHSEAEWAEILKTSIEDSEKMKFPSEILTPQETIDRHSFTIGMKLEAVNPVNKLQLCPATVVKVINKYYFLVEIDDYRKETDKKLHSATICCHSKSLVIFPIFWGKEHGVKIHFPKDFCLFIGLVDNPGNKEFDWNHYLKFCQAEAAPRELFHGKLENLGIETGMKLEAVNPHQTNQVCAATVNRVIDPLIWIQLDSIDNLHSDHILPMNSQDIFPVGWCESNGFPLKPPRTSLSKRQRKIMKRIGIYSTEGSPKKLLLTDSKPNNSGKDNSKAWCPIIYFNHKCFSGPLIRKSGLAELPKHVGPGPVSLVLKEVLTMLINVAYKSSRVLSELQLKGKPNAGMQEQVLKAKYKGKTHRAAVEIVKRSDQVTEFCKKICMKLECCPYLFGPVYVGEDCPEKCYTQTKTQYIQHLVKKRKVGRPPLIPKNEDGTPRGPGRKRKKKRWSLLLPTNSPALIDQSSSNSGTETGAQKENHQIEKKPTGLTCGEQAMKLKRKYKKFVAPKSAIVTRGAKLPNFGLNWRRHQESPSLLNCVTVPYAHYGKPGRPPKIKTINAAIRPKEVPKPVHPSITQPVPAIKINTLVNTNNDQKKLLQLQNNPLKWNVEDVVKYIRSTDCAPLARILEEQEVDGQAFLLLNLPTVQEFLELKLDPAVRLCKHIEHVKLAFYTSYA